MNRLKKLKEYILSTIHSFSVKERVIFCTIAIVLIVAVGGLIARFHQRYSNEVPSYGGKITEGIIGTPRFINPLLATSNGDKDLAALVYSGLVRFENNTFIPDLAESYTVSEDGLRYTFILRQDARFHDGRPITVDDVLFTISKVKDSALKSPQRISWEGVTVTQDDIRTIVFTLSQPYAGFLQNASIGIIPKHLWVDVIDDEFALHPLNTRPVGSGPYRITSMKKNNSGVPTKYTLKAFKHFTLGRPYIQKMVFKFYQNEDDALRALRHRRITALSAITPARLDKIKKRNIHTATAPLPRIFGVFWNQNNAPIFIEKSVTQAIATIVNKDRIINEVLFGYGTPIDSPLPVGLLPEDVKEIEDTRTTDERVAAASDILKRGGWTQNTETGTWRKGSQDLRFSLSTGNVPELKQTAELIKDDLALIGIPVDIKIFETGNLDQDVIRTRNYEALLFGEIIAHDTDLFAFWHSSQRNDPGLNIALYANTRVDSALEKALAARVYEERIIHYKVVEEELQKDTPALFIYSPDIIYFVPKKIQNIHLAHISQPKDRFTNIYTWYIKTDRLWRTFTNPTS